MATNASGLALFKHAMQTSSPHPTQEFAKKYFKTNCHPLTYAVQASLELSVKLAFKS